MKCPKCSNLDTRVVDSRITDDNTAIRRRRECESCHARFTTFERLEFVSFFVTKSDGKKEVYDRSKLEKSILKACNKRNIDAQQVEAMINSLEPTWAANKKGITSKRIGKDVLTKLKDVDDTAFLRFASVYHNFDSIHDFVEFVKTEFE